MNNQQVTYDFLALKQKRVHVCSMLIKFISFYFGQYFFFRTVGQFPLEKTPLLIMETV